MYVMVCMYKDVDTLLVFDSFYHSDATRDYLNQHKVMYIGALHPNCFKVQCDYTPQKGLQSWRLCWNL